MGENTNAQQDVGGWMLHVEPEPGVGETHHGKSGDALKALALRIWKRRNRWIVTATTFTIYGPDGAAWQTCRRTSDGSWRAVWKWPARPHVYAPAGVPRPAPARPPVEDTHHG